MTVEEGQVVARLDDSNHRHHLAVDEAGLALAQAQLDETRTSTEKALLESFMRQFGDIGTITTLILGAGFLPCYWWPLTPCPRPSVNAFRKWRFSQLWVFPTSRCC